MKCPNQNCRATLSDPFEGQECGWSNKKKPQEKAAPKVCFSCHMEIAGYYIGWRNKKDDTYRFKCERCLVYADLCWEDKLVHDWLEQHPEFKVKADVKEKQEMCMAYIRKIMRGRAT